MGYLNELQVEIATVDYFRELGYEYIHGALPRTCLHRLPVRCTQTETRHGRDAVKPAEAGEAVRKVEGPCC